MEFETQYIVPAVVLYLVFMGLFIVLPGKVGVASYPKSTLIFMGVILLPASYFIVKKVSER